MKTALITGANKSIGFEAARQLAQKGVFVYIGSRDKAKGEEAAEKLKSEGLGNVASLQLDVTSEESVKAARAELGEKTGVLDILINNAGISGGMPQTALSYPVDGIKEVFNTNLFGVVMVTQAFIDMVQKSEEPRIVNVTSGLGSLTLATDPASPYYHVKGAAYHPSKAALNMYTVVLAYELRDTAAKVNVVDPGYTKTDFNNHQGFGTVEDAAARVVKYALIGNDGPSGKFFSEQVFPDGECPW
ncbi:MAG: SDR family oxidoreductase [Williamsia sp.]|nr:SDR family oxidoreductase [Williamsia sp.]